MFLHYTTIKFLTKKRFKRENFSRKALTNGKKPSFLPFLSLFSSLHIMRTLFLLPLLAVAFPLLAQESASADAAKTAAHAIPAECKNLHKVTDIDDLFAQMYANINSHCLFNIAPEKLEDIWGIPVFDTTMEDHEERGRQILRKREFSQTAYGLYIAKSWGHLPENREKMIRLSVIGTDSYKEQYPGYEGNFGRGKLPQDFPEPMMGRGALDAISININVPITPPPAPENTVYFPLANYYWLNADFSPEKPAIVLSVGMTEGELGISIVNHVPSLYTMNFIPFTIFK